MNKLYTSIVLIIAALSLMSNSGGRGTAQGEAVTNAPGETGRTCASAGCHSGGVFDPTVSVELITLASETSTNSYKNGKSYTARVSIAASGAPNGYGFQMVALNETGASVGEWTPNDDTQTVTLDGRSYIEHSKRISDSVIEFSWTAPEEGEENITFYISANAVNGNGSPGGDGATNSSFMFEWANTLSTGDTAIEQLVVYPNPAADQINVQNHTSKNYSIYNVQGQAVQQGNLTNGQINTSDLNPGMYVLQLDNNKGISRFIKI